MGSRVRAHEKAEAERFKRRVQATTDEERSERLRACDADDEAEVTRVAGVDSRGRPSLRGVLPERGSSHRSRAPARPSALSKVIKNFDKVRVSDKYRRSRPRPRARIKGHC